MRNSIASRLLPIAGILALAATPAFARQPASALATPVATPAVTAPVTSPSWSGVYRVQLDGKSSAPAAIIVERTSEGLSAIMLVDEHGSPLSRLHVDGNTLTARVQTGTGEGTLTLRMDGEQITGSLKVGKQKWDVTGQRTA